MLFTFIKTANFFILEYWRYHVIRIIHATMLAGENMKVKTLIGKSTKYTCNKRWKISCQLGIADIRGGYLAKTIGV